MRVQVSKISGFGGLTGPRGPARAARLVWLAAALLVVSLVMPSSPARAELSRAGPVDPDTGLPRWLEDETGLRLRPCSPDARCENSDTPPGGDVTYWSATATVPTDDGSASLVLGTRGEPADRGSLVFGRIRISAGGLEPGATYTVKHPYGTETFTSAAGGRSIDFTEEVGCLQAPCGDFSVALNGRVGPWLTWDTLGASGGAPPRGYIGGPVPHRVHGSPVIDESGEPQNYFEIKGPDVGGPGDDTVKTDLFVVEGRIPGLTAFARPGSGSYETGQEVTLTASNPEGEVFYTTDGSEPTEDSTPYEKPVSITEDTTLKFIALGPDGPEGSEDDRRSSPVRTSTYTINDPDSP